MLGYVGYGSSKSKEVYDIARETVSIADIPMGERYVCLKYLFTVLAKVALNCKGQECLLAYREIMKLTVNDTILDDVVTTTMGTFHFFKRKTFEF